jgi:hypothetical protein
VFSPVVRLVLRSPKEVNMRKKALIGLALVVAFLAVIYQADQTR